MNKFAIAFRKARLASDKTFRQIKEQVGLSIGYLSDIENGKRNPPEVSIVKKIEDFLDITDGHLVNIAKVERVKNPLAISHIIKDRPKLQESLFRLDALPDEELDLVLDHLRKQSDQENDPWFYLNPESLKFFDKKRYVEL